ncbi:MAG: CDP-glycerol glycerophosphotransferase family protein [Dorea sp.]|nr:CDP-glycerol glycerophosphotransferase family protein [Dorea sp.]
MGVQAILNNVKTVGIKETYNISKKRKQERLTEHKTAVQLRKFLADLAEKTTSEEAAGLMREGAEAAEDSEVRKILCRLDKMKLKGYERAIKSKYIKEILPAVYNDFTKFHIEDTAIFMQPRCGLNQSCQYIYRKLEEQGKYKVVLRELHRGEVGVSEYLANAEKFVREMGTAKAVFVHESNNLMGYLKIRKETKVIQLWHGCGVFKKIGLSTSDKKYFKSQEAYEEFPEYNNYSLVTIASPELSWVFEEFMGIGKEEGIIKPMGVSRTDEFFDEEYVKNCYRTLYEVIPAARNKKVILYAPTYRGVKSKRVSPDKLDIGKFYEALGDEYILIFKHHQTVEQLPKIPKQYEGTFAYDMTRGKGMSINDLLTVADICISDYSSVVFEYALFERPMLFYVYDLEEYIDERGLYYEFDEITPGPLCRTNEEMIDYIKNVDERFDRQEVADFKNKFMCCCDGHATERILEFMEQ